MKLNKCFITCYLLVFNTLYHPHTFINLSPHLYFPFPTESRQLKRSATFKVALFLCSDGPSEARFRKGWRGTKNGLCLAETRLA